MNKKIIVGAVVAALLIAAGAYWLVGRSDDNQSHLTLHGNVDNTLYPNAVIDG